MDERIRKIMLEGSAGRALFALSMPIAARCTICFRRELSRHAFNKFGLMPFPKVAG